MSRINALTGVHGGCSYERYFGKLENGKSLWSPFVHLAIVFNCWMTERKFATSKPCWMK